MVELDFEALFAGRYRIVRRIAAGAMGAVFEVVHTETNRRRALKVMLPELLLNRDLRDRFRMEARVTANVDSEYIVDVFDAGIDSVTGMPFLVMELLQGEDVGEVLRRVGAITPNDAIAYLRQVASALDKTHAAAIVHRDLKPENLFLTHREDGSPRMKILDFGISKVVSDASTGANGTRILGTPLYMAPEQVLGQPVTSATDLYALGLVAYTMLVGVSYWQVDTVQFDNAIAFALHTTKGAPESALARAARQGRALPASFDAWFRRATHLQPAQRFQRASELVNELAILLGVGGAALAGNAVNTAAPAPPRFDSAPGKFAGGTVPAWGAATAPPAKPKSSAAWPIGGGVMLLAVVAFAFYLKRPTPAVPPAPESSLVSSATAKQASAPASASVTPQDEGKSAEGSAIGQASASASASSALVHASHSPAAHPLQKGPTPKAVPSATPPKANCDPNFYLDAQGDKHFKPECFGVHSHT